MNLRYLALGIILAGSFPLNAQAETLPPEKVEFRCEEQGTYPITAIDITTGAEVDSRNVISWLPKYFPETANAIATCQDAAVKLQALYDSDATTQGELMTGQIDDINVVCLAPKFEGCQKAEQVVFTLPTSDETSETVLKEMLDEETHPETPKVTLRGDFPMTFNLRRLWLPF
ncbi:MAG: COP23 domain-containing protein [Cyanobacteria bacterium P01_H01_bin.15]